MTTAKKTGTVAERIAQRLFKRMHRLNREPTHLEIMTYPGKVQHGLWTRAGVIAIITEELKKEARRAK